MARRKKQDEDSSEENVNNNDDTFGLPEIEYQPLQRDESPHAESDSTPTSQETETPSEVEREEVQHNEYNTTTNYYNNDEDEGNSPWPKILGIAAFLLVTAAAIWYFAVYRPKEQKLAADKARQEQEERDAKQREANLLEQKRIEDERRRADSLALATATPAVGEVSTLTERTGRYYVIIASGIDGDLIMDYAQKLAPKGLSPKIIPPHGKVKFYRLAIAEGDTYTSTQATADQLKGEYTDGAWVVRY